MHPTTTPDFVVPRIRKRRQRFLAVSVAGLAVLGASLGVSFLGNTGTITPTVSGSSPSFVYPVSSGASLPSAVNSLEYTLAAQISGAKISGTAATPTWSPTAQSAGSVPNGGDLALIDATGATNGVTVSLYITNLAGLQQDYSSLALPVNVYQSACTSGTCSWAQASGVSTTYLTATSGFLTFNLPTGYYYDITIEKGGSYYCTSTSNSGTATLAPSYYFTAQPY